MWPNHYDQLLNSSNDKSLEEKVPGRIGTGEYYFDQFTFEEVNNIFKKNVNDGQLPCRDNMYGDYFKFADNCIFRIPDTVIQCYCSVGLRSC